MEIIHVPVFCIYVNHLELQCYYYRGELYEETYKAINELIQFLDIPAEEREIDESQKQYLIDTDDRLLHQLLMNYI